MPIYEYKCPLCGSHREKLAKFDDPAPKCGEPRTPVVNLDADDRCPATMERAVSRSSFHLKGGGWFADGYGS